MNTLLIHTSTTSNPIPLKNVYQISFSSTALSGSYSILRISSANCGGCVGSGAIFGVDMDYLTNGGIIPWKKIHEIPRPTQIM
jgi:hypothetical protein